MVKPPRNQDDFVVCLKAAPMKNETTESAASDQTESVKSLRYVHPEPTGLADGRYTNFGDYIIRFATRYILSHFLPQPAATCDTRDGKYPEGEFDCLIVPGITHLGRRHNKEKFQEIRHLGYPTYCLSGAIWGALGNPGFLIRNRLIGNRPSSACDTTTAKTMATPVGARDPHTYSVLQNAGIETVYMGCPTLFLPAIDVADDGYVLFSFGRGHLKTQVRAGKKLAQKHHVIGICHEPGNELLRIRAAGWNLPLATFRGDVQLYLSYFKRASVIVTGRLHGALPSLAYGKPIFYYGTRDTRTTLLDDIGIAIHDYGELDKAVDQATTSFNRTMLDYYWSSWEYVTDKILRKHGCSMGNALPRGALETWALRK